MKYRSVLLGTLSTTHFVNDGLDMVLPVILPIIVEKLSLSFYQMGLIIASYTISSSFLQPIAGYASDITGRKKLYLCGGLFIFTLSLFLMQYANNLTLMISTAFAAGLGYSIYHPEGVAFIGYSIRERRGLSMGIHGFGGSAGRAFFPLLTSMIASLYGLKFSLWFILFAGVIVSLMALIFLQEINTTVEKSYIFKTIGPIIIILTIISILRKAFFYGTVSFIPTLFVNVFQADLIWSGASVFIMMIAGLVTQPIGGHLSDHIGRRKVFAISSFGTSVSFLAFLITTPPLSLIGLGLSGFFIFLGFPILFTMLSDIVPREALSANVGFVSGIGGIGAIVSPIIIGGFADRFGLQQSLFIPIAFIFVAGILTFLLPKDK